MIKTPPKQKRTNAIVSQIDKDETRVPLDGGRQKARARVANAVVRETQMNERRAVRGESDREGLRAGRGRRRYGRRQSVSGE